jgi:hypothetical protein
LTNEQTQDTRTATDVIREALNENWGPDDVIDALAAAGYTIAGPGSVVVDREALGGMIKQVVDAYFDPLPTQEGE